VNPKALSIQQLPGANAQPAILNQKLTTVYYHIDAALKPQAAFEE
jgi:hypothetical protein